MQKKSCRYLTSYSSGGSTHHEVDPAVHLGIPFWGRGDRRSAMVPFKEVVVSYRPRLSILINALSLTIRPQFAIECLRRSNQQRMGQFGAKFGEEGIDKCKPNFNAIWERHGAQFSVLYFSSCIPPHSALLSPHFL